MGGRTNYNSAATTSHVCGLREGQLFCWGQNAYGQLGSSGAASNTPRRVGAEADWTDVSAGGAFTCGIRGGELYCWGSNTDAGRYADGGYVGILGLGADYDEVLAVEEPTRVGEASDWVSVSAGTHHTCGIRESDAGERTLWCWGKGGQNGVALGHGGSEGSNVPVQEVTESTDWEMVASGLRGHTCGIRVGVVDEVEERTLWCWGHNSSFPWSTTSTPQLVGLDTDWQTVASGAWHVCGLRTVGEEVSAHCVGNNRHGQLGDGASSSTETFQEPGNLENLEPFENVGWSAISAGQGFTCGIKEGGLLCWGRGGEGQLGLGDASAIEACTEHSGHLDCREPLAVESPARVVFHLRGVAPDLRHRLGGSPVLLGCRTLHGSGRSGHRRADSTRSVLRRTSGGPASPWDAGSPEMPFRRVRAPEVCARRARCAPRRGRLLRRARSPW